MCLFTSVAIVTCILNVLFDMPDRKSIVGSWNISVPEGNYTIEFEHGSTSGKRVLWINGKEILRKDWMFRLVGPEFFRVGRFDCQVDVDPDGGFGLVYSLKLNGIPFKDFGEWCKKKFIYWKVDLANQTEHSIVFEKDSMEVWVNGTIIEPQVEFVEGGNLINFTISGSPVTIRSTSSGKRKIGIVYDLIVGDEILKPLD